MKQLCLLFFLGLSFQSFAQVTVEEFLRSAMQAPDVKTAEAQISYLNTSPYRLSPLQKLEFRTQNREMLTTQQEYALRVNPANPWEMHNTNTYFKEYKTSLSLEKERALKEALEERYELVILYFYYYELKRFAEESEKLLEKQLAVLERQSASSFFDADEYVKLKIELLDKKADKEEAIFAWQSQKSSVNMFYPNTGKLDYRWEQQPIIEVAQIERVADSILSYTNKPLEVAYFQQQVNVDKSRYDMEKSNINVGFLQTSYDRRRVNQERNPFVISLGVTIPVVNPNKADMARRKLTLIESETELHMVQQQEIAAREIAYQKLKQSIARHNQLQQEIEKVEKSDLPHQLTMLKADDPLIPLQFEEGIQKLKNLLVKHKRNVLTDYLTFLAQADYLQQLPLINYLSPQLSLLDK